MASLHISLKAEELFQIAGIPITNSMFTALIVTIILGLFAYQASRRKSLIPQTWIDHLAEIIIEGFTSLCTSISPEHGKKFFPLVTSIFLFVITSNWLGLLPGVGTITYTPHTSNETEHASIITPLYASEPAETSNHESTTTSSEPSPIATSNADQTHESSQPQHKSVPLFRAPTADLNMTLALAIIAVISIHVTGFSTIGAKAHIGKFLNFHGPIEFFVGILETIGELSKILSFSFRLFGNILAGEILITVLAFLIPAFVPLPFIGLEIFVGFIQAFVFAILTLIFCSLATQHH